MQPSEISEFSGAARSMRLPTPSILAAIDPENPELV
jgi:hypothetical protein